MTGVESRRCPRCGTVGAAGTLELCAACLLTTALAGAEHAFPYQIVAPMAQSGSGVTYLAQRSSRSRSYVALKVFGPRPDADDILTRYFEWKPALDRVHHPGIARLVDVNLTPEGLVYAATDYIAGWPLTALSAHPSVGSNERAALLQQLAAAVRAAHAEGILHL